MDSNANKLNHLLFFLFMGIGLSGFARQFDFVVAQDGTGDFETVQAAIDAVPDLRKNRTTIFIKSGTYKEKLVLPSTKTNVSFIGEDVETTILTFDDYASKPNIFGENVGTSGSSAFFIYGNGFEAYNITFENSAGPVGQAVAVRVDGDRVKFENCRFLGFQDTLYPHGRGSRQYYHNCYIEGTVDFIFGWGTAYFEDCEIFCKRNGYITAASTEEGTDFGFVFKNCRITGSAEPGSVYLGRPWRPYAQTVFIDCEMGEVVHPDGWDPWGSEEKKETAFYAEYGSHGPGGATENRVEWSHQLTEDQLSQYSLSNVMGDWNPHESRQIPRDTTYNARRVFEKTRPHHPEVELASTDVPDGVVATMDEVYLALEHTPFGRRELHADIFQPEAAGSYPAVILVHGGGWRSGEKSMQWALATRLAERGFVAVCVEYQLAMEAEYPAALHNLKAAVRWLRANAETYHVNPDEVAISGSSAGGQLALLTGLTTGVVEQEGNMGYGEYSSDIQAIIDIDGLADFMAPLSLRSNRSLDSPDIEWLGGSFFEKPGIWKEASPIFWAHEQSPPILVIKSGFPRFTAGVDELTGLLEEWEIYHEVHQFEVEIHPFWLLDPYVDPTVDYMEAFLRKVFAE